MIVKPIQPIALLAVALSCVLFSCKKDDHMTPEGRVFTLSNQTSANKVLAYSRKADGTLKFMADYHTGGKGTGAGLGSQGAVVLSENEDVLLAVNPGSNSVTSFTLTHAGLQLVSTVSSGGTMPVSVTVHHDLVYVLNAGGSGNIHGFKLQHGGRLEPISNSSKPLSSSNAMAAQISFVSDGSAVVITEKGTNKIISYTINAQGLPGNRHSITAANPTPFGFAVGSNRMIYVSEAAANMPGASSVSAYSVSSNGEISLIKGPVKAGQTAACWVVITGNEKYVYSTNTGSNTVSSFQTDNKTTLSVLKAVAATSGIAPIDAALSNDSKYLYVLNSGNETISAFSVAANGGLNAIQTISGLPDGASGMAAK